MKYIDQSGQGNTLLILTDADLQWVRKELALRAGTAAFARELLVVFERAIQRGTERMAAEFKNEQKAGRK